MQYDSEASPLSFRNCLLISGFPQFKRKTLKKISKLHFVYGNSWLQAGS